MATIKATVLRPGRYLGESMKALPYAEAGAEIELLAGPYAGNLIKQGFVSAVYTPPARDEVREVTFLGKDGPPSPDGREAAPAPPTPKPDSSAVIPPLAPLAPAPPVEELLEEPLTDEEAMAQLTSIKGIGDAIATKLLAVGVRSLRQLVLFNAVELSEDLGIAAAKIQGWQAEALAVTTASE